MNAGKTLDTKQLRISQRLYFDKSNLTQASWWLREDPLFSAIGMKHAREENRAIGSS